MKKTLYSLCLLLSCGAVAAQCVSGNCDTGTGTALYNKVKYTGQFGEGQIRGYGTAYYPEGTVYQGTWENRLPHGMGKVLRDNKIVWEGHWVAGIPHVQNQPLDGHQIKSYQLNIFNQAFQLGCLSGDCTRGEGVLGYADGSTYSGTFKDGKPDGYGKTIFINGDIFEGGYKSGYPHGIGRYKLIANQTIQKGRWEMGEFKGEVVSTEEKEGCVSGNCKNGKGVYIFKGAVAKFEGTFKNGLPHGEGVCLYSNGEKYEGQWADGKFNGQGVYTNQVGLEIKGIWQDGNFLGTGETSKPASTEMLVESGGKVYAAIIGISSYKHMPALKYSDDDAYRMLNFLQSPAGGAIPDNQIFFVVDEDATKVNILDGLQSLFNKAGKEDIVLIYFSGHGLQGAFLPIDYDGYDLKIYHEEILNMLDNSTCQKKLFIADACHSGSLVSKGSNMYTFFPETVSKFKLSPGSGFILSSKSEEISLESSGFRQGVFTHFLIRALKGEADSNADQRISIQELFDFIHQHVRTYTGNQQTPQIYGNYNPGMVVLELGK